MQLVISHNMGFFPPLGFVELNWCLKKWRVIKYSKRLLTEYIKNFSWKEVAINSAQSFMDDKESMSSDSFSMDENSGDEDKTIISRKRSRDGTPSADMEIPYPASFHGLPSQHFSSQGIMTAQNLVTHVVTVNPGEDIISKAGSIVEKTGRDIYIVSATGFVSHASICSSGHTSTYEGLYRIVFLTGYLCPAIMGGNYGRNNVTCCLTRTDGSVFGGSISGPFIAAERVQVVLWSFTHSSMPSLTPVGSNLKIEAAESTSEGNVMAP